MAWYRCGGGGVPASVKTDMNAVLNKKFGTSTDYPPADWAPTVNLMGPLPEKTQASASVCAFSDGADDVPTKSLVVTIPPTLSGVSSLNETQTGKNFISSSDFEQGSINSSGVDIDSTSRLRSAYIPVISGEDYSFAVTGTDMQIYFVFEYSANKTHIVRTSVDATSGSITLRSNTAYFRLLLRKTNNTNLTPSDIGTIQLEKASSPSTFEPYNGTTYTASLGRTIYGGTADIVNGTGTDENGNDFTFDGQEIPTRLGYNAFWSDEGDTEVTYRADIDLLLGGN